MKILMVSVFQNTGGYSDCATEQALSLDEVGVNVVCRSVSMDNTKKPLSDKMKELHNKDLNNIDVVFQNNLPSEFSYKGGVKNVGFFAYETTGWPNTTWTSNLSLLDKIIVPCNFQYDNMPEKLMGKTVVVPEPLDTTKFDKTYEEMDFGLPKNCTKFYTIAEYNKRKNLPALLISYFSAFDSSSNVALIIKTGVNGLSEEDSREKLKSVILDVKKGCNRFSNLDKYPKVILINQRLTDSQILSLHKTGDCFCATAHSESFCIPAVEAACMQNVIIVPKYGAFLDYADICGKMIETQETTVFGYPNSIGLYSSNELWGSININKFSEAMKQVHQSKQSGVLNKDFFAESSKFIKNEYSRKNIGSKLRNILEN